jgi:glycosyltransferase involved in cell wall biosynthesis
MGGGIRLLRQLAPAIARSPKVEFVRLAVPAGALKNKQDWEGIEISELSEKPKLGAVRSWLESEGRVLGVRGTGRLRASIRRRFLTSPDKTAWQNEQLELASADCDVIYCFWPHHNTFPRVSKPVVCTYQDTTLIDFPEILGGIEAQKLKEMSLGWVENSTVVVSSEATKKNLIRLFGPKCESAPVIHHAILPESDGFVDPRPSALREKLDREYLIFPAHPTSSKNHYALLEAWARFERRKYISLIFLGAGTETLTLPAHDVRVAHYWPMVRVIGLIARLQLRSGLDFHALGYVDDRDLLALLQGAKALIMPTLAEGGGSYPVEEALVLGTPVLCSDIPVMREHLSYHSAKVAWFDPQSPDSILSALNELLDNYQEYKESTLQGMKDPRPSWDDIAGRYVNIFRLAIERNKTTNESS